jgi:hypothetical protein
LVLLLLVSLFSTVKLTRPTEQFVPRFSGIIEIVPDHVTLYEHRFSALRPLLPPHGTVGYVMDQDFRDYDEKWVAVQYALAPVLVARGSHYDLIVGNITQPMTDLHQFLHHNNLVLLKNLGDGVLLLEGTLQ